MKLILITLLTFISSQSLAKTMMVKLSPWVSECKKVETENGVKNDCKPPVAIAKPQVIEIDLKSVDEPGSADVSIVDFNFNDFIKGEFKAFSIFPHPQSPYPPYVQFQYFQTSPIELICGHSIEAKVPFLVPPLICAASAGNGNDRYGVTVEFLNDEFNKD